MGIAHFVANEERFYCVRAITVALPETVPRPAEWLCMVKRAHCQRRGEMSHFRHDKMSHFLRVKRLPSGWLPRSSLAFLLLHWGV